MVQMNHFDLIKKINTLYNLPVCFHSVLFLLVSVLNLLVHWKFGRPTWTCCSRLLSLEGSVKNMWPNPSCGLLLLLFAVLLVLWFSPCCGEEMPKYTKNVFVVQRNRVLKIKTTVQSAVFVLFPSS